ncbi:MAG: Asp23/Gls24 family envelope stress response protein [Coriobacteriales bacterium]|jgi:uncharacterized alkaline shock family protein YloU|nr:Asp23/Gls24 family envelope stress response protein [Coriobacteriales bacterium]
MTTNPEHQQITIGGDVHVTDDVLTDLVGYAAMESYGVVGMAAPSLQDGIAKLLPARALSRGVTISKDPDGINANLYVVIEHGMNLSTVSKNLADRVRFVLESFANLKVKDVSVHVQGVHMTARTCAKTPIKETSVKGDQAASSDVSKR